MILAPGNVRFTTTGTPPVVATYLVDAAGIHTTFGVLVYDPVEDVYTTDDDLISIRILDATHFVADRAGKPFAGTYVHL